MLVSRLTLLPRVGDVLCDDVGCGLGKYAAEAVTSAGGYSRPGFGLHISCLSILLLLFLFLHRLGQPIRPIGRKKVGPRHTVVLGATMMGKWVLLLLCHLDIFVIICGSTRHVY